MNSITFKQIIGSISENTEIEAAVVKTVLEDLAGLVEEEVSQGNQIRVPGVAVLTPVFVEAKPRRKGINRFTGEEQMFDAKPSTMRLKARPAPGAKNALPTARSASGKAVGAAQASKIKARKRAASARAKENGTGAKAKTRARA